MGVVNINRAIRYRAYPTPEQEAFFANTFGCVRFVWNQMLGDAIYFHEATDKFFIPTPAKYKKEHPFLRGTDSLALANAQLDLQKAFKNYFEGDAGFPHFKSKKHSELSYTTNCQVSTKKDGTRSPTVYIGKNFIRLPKAGNVRIVKHRSPKNGWQLKSATVEKTSTGKYFISVLFEFTENIEPVQVRRSVGLDYSSSDFYVDDCGNRAHYPKYYRAAEERLALEQRRLTRMVEGSRNYLQQKAKIASIHERIANQRKDFCHQLSRKIANSYDAVFVEDINLCGMAGGLHLGKSTNDNGFGLFRLFLEYKLAEQGKVFHKIDKWYPSSKTCSNCGFIYAELTLSDRKWTCSSCGIIHDRDVNAAIKIKREGLRSLGLT